MGDTDNGGGSPTGLKNPITRARALVIVIPIILLAIGGLIALANSNIFAGFQSSRSSVAQNSATTEAALARDMEREARVLDVIQIEIIDNGVYLWIVDLEAGEEWSDRDSDAVTRAFDVLFEYAKDQNLKVSIVFFRITSLMGTEGLPVDVFQGVGQFNCSAEIVADYGLGGFGSDTTLRQCELTPDGMFIAPTAEVPFIGR